MCLNVSESAKLSANANVPENASTPASRMRRGKAKQSKRRRGKAGVNKKAFVGTNGL